MIRIYFWTEDAQMDTELIYLHADHLDTPRIGTNSSGTIVWQWNSDAFGSLLPNEDPDGNGMPTTVNLRFPGQYFDKETNLHYNYFRDYDPKIGRYLESDPIGLAGGLNTFGYVGQNPLSNIDAEGLRSLMPQGTIYRGTGDIYGQIWIGNQMRNGAIQSYDSLQRRTQDLFNPQFGKVCKLSTCNRPIPQRECTSSNPNGAAIKPNGPQITTPGTCLCIEWTTGLIK